MNQTILLVDDEPGIRHVLEISLADMGYRVHTAADGVQALRIFREFMPPIVLTDIRMPGMDGIELLAKIKDHDPDVEVIMITGHGDMDSAIRSLKGQAIDFITKPINMGALEIALLRACERISMRRRLRQYTENLEQLVAERSRRLVEAERLAAVGQTVAGLSHAIKNIANGLQGGLYVLEQGIRQTNEVFLQQGWEMTKGNVDTVLKLSMDLLNYGRFTHVQRRRNDPNQPLRAVVATMEPRARELGIGLTVELSPALDDLSFDPEGIHHCLLNLATNALEACREARRPKGSMTVALRTVKVEGWGVEYQVADNGPGMDSHTRNSLSTVRTSKSTPSSCWITCRRTSPTSRSPAKAFPSKSGARISASSPGSRAHKAPSRLPLSTVET